MRALRILLVGFCTGCAGDTASEPPAASPPIVEHGDHDPHHGGIVMMKGDLHYEVVLDPGGSYRLYFTDAVRTDLPASTAVRASITVVRPGEPPEGVELSIDDAGESWVGRGRPVTDPGETTVRVAYTVRGDEPYWIDLPFDAQAPATDPHATRPLQ